MSTTINGQYERAGVLPVSFLNECQNEKQSKGKRKTKHIYKEMDINENHVFIKMDSARYATFKRSLTCACCGIKGEFLAVERNLHDKSDKYHLNLYGLDKNGNEVLMTKDHILPKSKGGSNAQYNYTTMCAPCNNAKRNNDDKTVINSEISTIFQSVNNLANRINVLKTHGIISEDELDEVTSNILDINYKITNIERIIKK